MQQRPLTIRAAERMCAALHRHAPHVEGGCFAVGAMDGDRLCGAAIVARPCRALDDGYTADIKRVTTDGTRNACSFLYGAVVRILQVSAYRRVLTYTLASESGASLRAAGFRPVADVRADSGDRPSRRRRPRNAIAPRVRWERGL